MTEHGSPQPSEPTHEPAAEEIERRARQVRNNKRQSWIYLAVGAVLVVLGVMGVMADDRGILDWLMLGLGVLNLVIGGMGLRRPEPPLSDSTG
ncbi:hypothetical protein [Ornithinimicrobium cryptoxanthini]|uniref:Uncharacterized protein n=1 Tax=Ornithinimicrobium cryptoxanthini TaxID=2934161 RepID=A0ABY4YL90_9MICO|nr:hypothetical protein [Ornithinimicrobium cryptoxanthini]USQ77499.1 hypothetical protein NF557_06215 [Ornithinimicrobium cryptoxanthini]